MMRYLLDTHIFIWWMEKNKRLSKDIFNLLNNPQNQIFLSVASVWELIIKKAKKKLKTPKDVQGGIKASGFIPINIEMLHVLDLEKLPMHHNDPFDRIIISQAKIEHLTLITADKKIWKYNLALLKA
ncbi:MAG: hypothetical protein A3C22_00155 [Candidatus Levybacteria bacterium RIFCSPHIGHO2_02_FULL_37_10]|nr:MAG: hypothetical protein A3C22_00155 [Candidatus Levybacteria bacterium RIFCSPHIGHO2_02_FULL_37_10]